MNQPSLRDVEVATKPHRRLWDPNWSRALPFLLPNFLGFLCFTLFPVLLSFVMAFHHWTLRPNDEVQFVALRNFSDLLGLHPLVTGQPTLALTYLLAVAGLLGGLGGALLANVKQWRGTKIGGLLIGLTGMGMLVVALGSGGLVGFWSYQSTQGSFFGGIIAVLCGAAVISREDSDWQGGIGVVPGLLIASSVTALWLLNGPMWSAYEPNDVRFWYYLYNTLFLMMGLPLAIIGALSLALLLNRELPLGPWRTRLSGALVCLSIAILSVLIGMGIGWTNVGVLAGIAWLFVALGFGFNIVSFRTIFYLPQFTSGVAVFILWKSLYRPETGPINLGLEALFSTLGLSLVPPSWLAEIPWAKPAIVFMGVWIFIGGQNMLLYLAALSNVPQDLLDAAEVDGAGRWQRFRHVTWPQLAPTTFFISVISIIGGLQGGFEQARVMTEGGPAGSTTTLSYYIYNKMFLDLDMGYAAAISWVLFAMIFVATAINWRFGRSQEVEM